MLAATHRLRVSAHSYTDHAAAVAPVPRTTAPQEQGVGRPTWRQSAPRTWLSSTRTHTSAPTCVDDFIDRFGTKAFRRPLDAETHERLRALYDEIAPTEWIAELRKLYAARERTR